MNRPQAASVQTRPSNMNSEPSTPVNWKESVWTWFWGGLLLACLPMLVIYFSRMWRLPHYQYFPFAITAVVWLAWTRSDRTFRPPTTFVSIAALALGGVTMAGGLFLRSPWMVAIAFFFFSTGCLSVMQGRRYESLIALALPLALLVRLPLGYDQLLVIELQRMTTVLSSLMLDVLRVPHSVARNVIEMPARELFVAEACSGIQSVFTLAFLSTLLIAIFGRRLWLTPFYLVIALILAIAGNVVRVTTVACVETWFGWDWAEGWAHDLLGYATLGLSSLLLVSFDQLIVAVLHPTNQAATAAKHNPVIRLWNWSVDDGSMVDPAEQYFLNVETPVAVKNSRFSRWTQSMNARQRRSVRIAVVLASISLVGVTTVRAVSVDPMGAAEGGAGMFVDGILFDPPQGLVESFADKFRLSNRSTSRDNENPILGQNSDAWAYTGPEGIMGQFVISQTYAGFHELCFCYENQDWLLLNRHLKSSASSDEDGNDVPIAYALFRTSKDAHGHLWYASVTASGKVVRPPERPGRIGSRFADTMRSDLENNEPIMMVQLWLTTTEPLDTSVNNRITDDFVLLRRKLAEEVPK
ncbi:exosortase U [Neorhodopirellula pilleata]|uniref:Transmembrane exosortase n=1 Tax=Neorhodopirellula pilleata TaxID=2714738 RepID=A0A5C6A4I8_9BACT|nr:exosortase U [Neorhodopirellula pilleata]TWT94290.1 Transmembrane exosortase [Neorhodopirellula pilleata]